MIDPARLGPMLRERRLRHGWSLRRAAEEIGVSFNTVARVEGGNLPDLETYRKLSDWLGVAGEQAVDSEATASTMEAIAGHLRQDPALTEADAQRIGRVVSELYEALARPTRTSAVHLRTASTFRPATARLLGEILGDMRQALESLGATR